MARLYKLNEEKRLRVEDEIVSLLHACRDRMRNRKELDTVKVTLDANCPYYAEAFGMTRTLTALGYTTLDFNVCAEPYNGKGIINPAAWFDSLTDRCLEEENFGGSNECDHCLEHWGKDSAGRKSR